MGDLNFGFAKKLARFLCESKTFFHFFLPPGNSRSGARSGRRSANRIGLSAPRCGAHEFRASRARSTARPNRTEERGLLARFSSQRSRGEVPCRRPRNLLTLKRAGNPRSESCPSPRRFCCICSSPRHQSRAGVSPGVSPARRLPCFHSLGKVSWIRRRSGISSDLACPRAKIFLAERHRQYSTWPSAKNRVTPLLWRRPGESPHSLEGKRNSDASRRHRFRVVLDFAIQLSTPSTSAMLGRSHTWQWWGFYLLCARRAAGRSCRPD